MKNYLLGTASRIPYLAALAYRRQLEAKLVAKLRGRQKKDHGPRLSRQLTRDLTALVPCLSDEELGRWLQWRP